MKRTSKSFKIFFPNMDTKIGYGDCDCSTRDMIKALKGCDISFPYLNHFWPGVAKDVGTPQELVMKISAGLKSKEMELEDAIYEILTDWAKRKDYNKKPTLRDLLRVLKGNSLDCCAARLTKVYKLDEESDDDEDTSSDDGDIEDERLLLALHNLHSAAVGEGNAVVCIEKIKKLLEQGAWEVGFRTNYLGHTFLQELIFRKELDANQYHDLVEFLVGINLVGLYETVGMEGNLASPLQYGVGQMVLEDKTLELLKSSGVDFNHKDKDGENVLWFVLLAENAAEYLEKLIGLGADVYALNKEKRSILHAAARFGSEKALKYLLRFCGNDGGIDLNGVDEGGDTALHLAVRFVDRDDLLGMVKVLVEEGKADVGICNLDGFTPLAIALKRSELGKELVAELKKFLKEKMPPF